MKLLSIYDKQAGFNPPMVHASEGAAIRWFGEQCNDEKSPMHKHPEDFELMVIGEFDEYQGVHGLCEARKICTATQFVPETIKNAN